MSLSIDPAISLDELGTCVSFGADNLHVFGWIALVIDEYCILISIRPKTEYLREATISFAPATFDNTLLPNTTSRHLGEPIFGLACVATERNKVHLSSFV